MNKTPSKNPANMLHATRMIIRMAIPPWPWILAPEDSTCLWPAVSLCVPLIAAFMSIGLRLLGWKHIGALRVMNDVAEFKDGGLDRTAKKPSNDRMQQCGKIPFSQD